MRFRGIAGACMVALPLLYLLAVNLALADRLGSEAPLRPLTAADAWSKAFIHVLLFMVVPLAGLLIAVGPDVAATRLRSIFAPAMPAPAALRLTAWLALTLLGLVLALTAVVPGGDRGLFALETSRSAFSTLPFHAALALSAAAALAEEVLFRGLVLRGLMHRVRPAVAIGAQAVAFGAIHIAYGSGLHAAMATIFGVLLALVALRAGLWCAILVHLEVNILLLALWSDVQATWPVALGVLVGAVALLVVARRHEKAVATVENGTDAPGSVPNAPSA